MITQEQWNNKSDPEQQERWFKANGNVIATNGVRLQLRHPELYRPFTNPASGSEGTGGGTLPKTPTFKQYNAMTDEQKALYNPMYTAYGQTGWKAKPDAMLKFDVGKKDTEDLHTVSDASGGAPPAPTPTGVMRDSYQGQHELLPLVYADEAKYRPLYAQLDANIMKDILTGKTNMLGWYQNQVEPVTSQISANALRTQRTNDIQDVETLGPRATAAYEAANPRYATLMNQMMGERTAANPLADELGTQAQSDLALGTSLAPADIRDAQQASRAAWSARGLATGENAAGAEVLGTYQLGRQRQNERRSFATTIEQLLREGRNQKLSSGAGLTQLAMAANDPFMTILGRPSSGTATASGMLGMASGMTGATNKLIDPMNPFGSSVASTGAQSSANTYNTNMGTMLELVNNRNMTSNANSIAQANLRASRGSVLGDIFGAGLSGLTMGIGGAVGSGVSSIFG
jgi:hypothetical protein